MTHAIIIMYNFQFVFYRTVCEYFDCFLGLKAHCTTLTHTPTLTHTHSETHN